LVVSFAPNSSGTVSLISGALSANAETVGGGGTSTGAFTNGVFNQSGGFNFTSFLKLGQGNSEAVGVYSISNGAALNVSSGLVVGDAGIGTFNQRGGNVSVFGPITLANGTAAIGIYNLSGGVLVAPSLTTHH